MDYKYLNIELYNDTEKPIIANYYAEYVQPIIADRPSDYKLSIIRFNVPSSTIPIFVFENNSYYVTLRHSGTDFQSVVIYSGNNTTYGFNGIYHYQEFITQINTALQTAFTALKTAFPGVPATEAPYLTYDSPTQLCTFWAQKVYEGSISVFMNSTLYTFFDNFNAKFYGFNLSTKRDFEILITDNKNNSNGSYYFFPQEYPALYYWNDLRTITFMSNMPIANESSPSNINNIEGLSNYVPILTDFQPLNSNDGELRSYLQYQASIYRYTDITTDDVLRKVSLKIFWEDKKGTVRPVYIQPGEIISVKFMFERK